MIQLSVNVNKIATLRNSRGGHVPSVIAAVDTCLAAGAPGITVHPRADARHITTADVYDIGRRLAPERGRIEFAGSAFTNWHEPSSLMIDVDGTNSTEAFEPCDAYALMVDAVSRRIAGDENAWILPLSESLRVAATMDAVRAACP